MALYERKKMALDLLADIENANANAAQNAVSIDDVMTALVELADIVVGATETEETEEETENGEDLL